MLASVAKGNDETVGGEALPFDFLTIILSAYSMYIGIWFVRSGQSLLPRRGYLDPAIPPTMAVLLAGTMFVLFGVGWWWGASHAPDGTIAQKAWVVSSAIVAQIPVIIAYGVLRRRCGSRRILEISVIAFAVFAPMAIAVAGILHGLFILIQFEPPTAIGHETLLLLSKNEWTSATWVVILGVTIGAGIVEEVLYRGLILPTFSAVLGGKSAWGAIVATSIFFAMMHIGASPPSAIIGLFVLSIGLCWARVKSGGVLAPIAIHIVFNTMNIAFVYSTIL